MLVRRCLIRWKLASPPSVLWLELEGLGLDVSLISKMEDWNYSKTSGEV